MIYNNEKHKKLLIKFKLIFDSLKFIYLAFNELCKY